MSAKTKGEAATSALTFYDLLIEAHPVLISDEWRRSEPQDKGGAHAVAEASDPLTQACGSTRTDAFGSGNAVCATTVPAVAVGTPRGCRGCLVPHSS
jgi:hypothetical protein